jgi:hypothetical protein
MITTKSPVEGKKKRSKLLRGRKGEKAKICPDNFVFLGDDDEGGY